MSVRSEQNNNNNNNSSNTNKILLKIESMASRKERIVNSSRKFSIHLNFHKYKTKKKKTIQEMNYNCYIFETMSYFATNHVAIVRTIAANSVKFHFSSKSQTSNNLIISD